MTELGSRLGGAVPLHTPRQSANPVAGHMNDTSRNIRKAILEHVVLLASATQQREYAVNVPAVSVPTELICGFSDDLFHPKDRYFIDAFSEEELKDLSILYGLLHCASEEFEKHADLSVEMVLKLPEWRAVMAFAKELQVELERG